MGKVCVRLLQNSIHVSRRLSGIQACLGGTLQQVYQLWRGTPLASR